MNRARRAIRNWMCGAVSYLCVALCTSSSHAVVVLLKGNAPPAAGYLVSEDNQKIVIREVSRAGVAQLRTIPRSQVDELLVSVSVDRLASLSADRPRGYFDYAEELAEKRQDPEARDAALRLYHIAAFLAPQQLGRSALLGMAGIASRPADEAKFRAMAFLMDPAKDRSVLKSATELVIDKSSAETTGRQALLTGIRQLRRGDVAAAKKSLERTGVREEFASLQGTLSYDECVDACVPNGVSDGLLRRIVVVELALMDPVASKEKTPAPNTEPLPWSRQLQRSGVAAMPVLDLEKITEFDPRANRFYGGRWIRGDEEM